MTRGVIFVLLALLLGSVLWVLTREPGSPPRAPSEGPPRRLVSLAPNLTEMVLALGEADRLVGVTRYCEGVPPEVERVGGIEADLERIVALRPDRVLAVSSRAQTALFSALGRLGYEVVLFSGEGIEDVRAALRGLGELLDREERARTIVAGIDAALEPREGGGRPPRVAFVVGRAPLFVATGSSFVQAILEAAGAENVFAAETTPFLRVELERLLEADPDLIVDSTVPVSVADPRRVALDYWRRFDRLRAVRARAVHPFPPVTAGLRIPEWIEELRAIIDGVALEEAPK